MDNQSSFDSQEIPQVQSEASSGDITPEQALDEIREKLQGVVSEYAAGRMNSPQFNAIYKHYSEKRTIIERLIERDPETDAWRSVANQGNTGIIHSHFEARPLFFVVFRSGDRKPLISGGKLPRIAAQQIYKLLQVIWAMNTPRTGVARKSVGDGKWLVMVMGEHALTLVIFSLQPSSKQTSKVKELHSDFEHANHRALSRDRGSMSFVFPQRSLLK